MEKMGTPFIGHGLWEAGGPRSGMVASGGNVN
jgi:hypothetical protein